MNKVLEKHKSGWNTIDDVSLFQNDKDYNKQKQNLDIFIYKSIKPVPNAVGTIK